MSRADACDRLDRYIAEGRLLRSRWTDRDAEGRHLACLLAALSPECGEAGSVDRCPAELLWPWLAHLTPWIDDAGSADAWPTRGRRRCGATRRSYGDSIGSLRNGARNGVTVAADLDVLELPRSQ